MTERFCLSLRDAQCEKGRTPSTDGRRLIPPYKGELHTANLQIKKVVGGGRGRLTLVTTEQPLVEDWPGKEVTCSFGFFVRP